MAHAEELASALSPDQEIGGSSNTAVALTVAPFLASLATPQPHNNLLVTVANSWATRKTTFGNPACCTGLLSLA